jgi:serine/threonine protein kinase
VEETFGRYRLLERLGEGATAEVWKAKSFGVEGFEKILAVKRLLPAFARYQRFSERFVQEAKLALRLSHANVVQVFDLGAAAFGQEETCFIAMEYVAGLDLATLVARCREQGVELPIGMCVYVAAEVAKGLEHAHRRRDEQLRPLGIVHGDVSARNVLLSWEGEVKLSDFGVGRARDVFEQEIGPPRLRAGQYAYMSPEQAGGQSVDARADMFSLGVVLYEMLTSVNPLRAPSVADTVARARACEFPPVEMLRPGVPEGIASLLDKALSRARAPLRRCGTHVREPRFLPLFVGRSLQRERAFGIRPAVPGRLGASAVARFGRSERRDSRLRRRRHAGRASRRGATELDPRARSLHRRHPRVRARGTPRRHRARLSVRARR